MLYFTPGSQPETWFFGALRLFCGIERITFVTTSVFQICSTLQLHSETGWLAPTMVTRTLAAPVPIWNAKSLSQPSFNNQGDISNTQPSLWRKLEPSLLPIISQCNPRSPSWGPAVGKPPWQMQRLLSKSKSGGVQPSGGHGLYTTTI